MDHLWSPWRYRYVTTADSNRTGRGVPPHLSAWPDDHGCVFCNLIGCSDFAVAQGMAVEESEAAAGIVHRGRFCFVCLNAYPYTSGHIMVVPYAHLDQLKLLPVETAHEMMDLTQRAETILQRLYKPQGTNIGMNLGQAAGAGIADHLHMHVLPRWMGDTNFMTTIGETRVLPEELGITWKRMHEAFGDGVE